jgi:hypothetical protein
MVPKNFHSARIENQRKLIRRLQLTAVCGFLQNGKLGYFEDKFTVSKS